MCSLDTIVIESMTKDLQYRLVLVHWKAQCKIGSYQLIGNLLNIVKGSHSSFTFGVVWKWKRKVLLAVILQKYWWRTRLFLGHESLSLTLEWREGLQGCSLMTFVHLSMSYSNMEKSLIPHSSAVWKISRKFSVMQVLDELSFHFLCDILVKEGPASSVGRAWDS